MARITESSLSKLWEHIQNNDCGTISGFRSKRDCGTGERYTNNENKKKNRLLLLKLQNLRYSITSIKGSYIENFTKANAVEVDENAFFVSDIDNRGKLYEELLLLGEEFEQETILFIPEGGEYAKLVGTTRCEDPFIKYHKEKKYSNSEFGKSGEFFSKVSGNRPFSYTETIMEHRIPQGMMARWACSSMSKQTWEETDIE